MRYTNGDVLVVSPIRNGVVDETLRFTIVCNGSKPWLGAASATTKGSHLTRWFWDEGDIWNGPPDGNNKNAQYKVVERVQETPIQPGANPPSSPVAASEGEG